MPSLCFELMLLVFILLLTFLSVSFQIWLRVAERSLRDSFTTAILLSRFERIAGYVKRSRRKGQVANEAKSWLRFFDDVCPVTRDVLCSTWRWYPHHTRLYHENEEFCPEKGSHEHRMVSVGFLPVGIYWYCWRLKFNPFCSDVILIYNICR